MSSKKIIKHTTRKKLKQPVRRIGYTQKWVTFPFLDKWRYYSGLSNYRRCYFEGYHQRWRDYTLPRDYRSLTTKQVVEIILGNVIYKVV